MSMTTVVNDFIADAAKGSRVAVLCKSVEKATMRELWLMSSMRSCGHVGRYWSGCRWHPVGDCDGPVGRQGDLAAPRGVWALKKMVE